MDDLSLANKTCLLKLIMNHEHKHILRFQDKFINPRGWIDSKSEFETGIITFPE